MNKLKYGENSMQTNQPPKVAQFRKPPFEWERWCFVAILGVLVVIAIELGVIIGQQSRTNTSLSIFAPNHRQGAADVGISIPQE